MEAILRYLVYSGKDSLREVRLTVCDEADMALAGLAKKRRARIRRLLEEARSQGVRLTYTDLCMILLSSRATLKRDIRVLRSEGYNAPLRGLERETAAAKIAVTVQ